MRESHRANQVIFARHTPANRWRGERIIGANQVYALTPTPATGGEERSHRANQVYAAHHTPATGGEERET